MRNQKLYIKIRFRLVLLIITLVILSSCEKFVEVDPPSTQITGADVYSSRTGATAVLTGIYGRMMSDYPGFANGAITLFCGLSSDELENYSPVSSQSEFFTNALRPSNNLVTNLWFEGWRYIYSANAVIAGVESSSTITADAKTVLIGEAKFIRAFVHFYLVNLFGDIPYVTSTDYNVNTQISRQPVSEIYNLIVADLLDAEKILPSDYSISASEKIRPNRFAAKALLARVFAYLQKWEECINQATEVIEKSNCSVSADLGSVFLKNSEESIWQLQPIEGEINTLEGNRLILTGAPELAALSKSFVFSLDSNDLRKRDWIQSIVVGTDTFYYPFKYKVKSGPELLEYYTVLRLAEQYLLRAESYAHLNNIAAAQSDLNVIRNRAGLQPTSASDQTSMLNFLEEERRVELFAEWGHRWLDLKRTGRIDEVLTTLKTGWQSTDALYPVPLIQIQNDPNFIQNPGY